MTETNQLQQILDAIHALQFNRDSYSSHEVKDLYAALSKAQGEYGVVTKNRENPYFKSDYADFNEIMRPVRPALAKHGLSFLQQLRINEEGATILHSILAHGSGQWTEARTRIIPVKNDPQTFGSTLTYHKRYAAMALLGITVSDDPDDDDAEKAVHITREKDNAGTAVNLKYNPREQSPDVITKEQLDELLYEVEPFPDIAEKVMDGLKIQSLADMPKNKYHASMVRIREIKQIRNGK